ncbi:MAG TPA: PASTA domain-containing protein, partial [Candidatus Methylomirabilis sp.]|nr:PASTA domain-containing protein [Candidatus Methylomirabilis sp.]
QPSRLRSLLHGLLKFLGTVTGLIALAMLSGLVAMHFVMEKDRVEVPRTVGLDSVAASQLIEEVGLTPRVLAEEFSATIPKGRVARQRPPIGARVKLGSEVRLILSRGTDQLEVPSLAGENLPQAQRILAEAGLTLGSITHIHSDVHAQETIIAQDPPAGSTATRGATVTILQSLGPWDETVTMPDLLGREYVTAMNLLKELQLGVRVSFEKAASREGHVVAQIPPPGDKTKVGSQVQITVGE